MRRLRMRGEAVAFIVGALLLALMGRLYRIQQINVDHYQRLAGKQDLIGLMLESNLFEGHQNLGDDPARLRYGVSITDQCLGWDESETLLREAHAQLGK